MKILRIQGKNLASIAGEFDIDFTAAPLRSAGIFAICGPTGAGKSTILDAICLALFNNMPRTTGIEGTKMPDVGQEFSTWEIVVKYSAEVLPKRWLL